MPTNSKADGRDVLEIYADYERQVTIRHLKIGCWLVIVLMPLGVTLDYFVYPELARRFLNLRLVCSLLEGVVWGLFFTRAGQRWVRPLGLIVAMLPVFFISWMIWASGNPSSPYYAGLNLILIAVAIVMGWDVGLSIAAVALTTLLYLGACLAAGPVKDYGGLYNNLYFLALTGVIVVTGSRVHRRLRVREFTLRYELDQSRGQLEESNRKLVELNEVKNRFFANVSHELRTPLTLLLAPLEHLLHRPSQPLDAPSRQLLQTMHTNSMRLLKLINDLLDLVRLESGAMRVKREPVEIAGFVRGLASAARQLADDRRITLETRVSPELGTLLADRDKLEKILLNLQFNALKFTGPGGRVLISAARQDGELVFEVEDTGMGIAQKSLPFVFDRFWQADTSSRRKHQGVGIGLALVKELTEAQDGRVSVQSQEGKGARFTVRLPHLVPGPDTAPAEEPAPEPALPAGQPASQEWLEGLYRRAELLPGLGAPQEPAPRAAAPGTGKPRLLVADDEPDMRRFLVSQLEDHYDTAEAADGQQAVDQALAFRPDLVIMDMMMPEKDGLQASREIRAQPLNQHTPILMLTARADEDTKLAALSSGASDFLAKPFSTTELHLRVRNLVVARQFQHELGRQNTRLTGAIDQLKETELQLVHSEKLAALGRMSAGIIHEINNPLSYAKTGLYTLRSSLQLLPPEHRPAFLEVLRDVEDGVNRVKEIVTDLRPLTQPDLASLGVLDLNHSVDSALRFFSHEWSGRVQIHRSIPPGQTVRAHPGQLIQVLVNLLQNSLEALRRKPFIPPDAPALWIEAGADGEATWLRLRDNGPGIPPEARSKIFEPFFTTKPVGEGMGLGLSICHRILAGHGGAIDAESPPGQGCQFTLRFPNQTAPAPGAPNPAGPPP